MAPDKTLLVNIIAEVRATSVFGTAGRSISLAGLAGFADAYTPPMSMLSFATMPLDAYAAPTAHSSQQVCCGFLFIRFT